MNSLKYTFNLVLVTLFLIIGTSALNAQSCLMQGLTIQNQAQVDAFAANYPNCIEIEGNLSVTPSSAGAITDLSPLSQIEKINGNFFLQNLDNITDFSAFDQLQEIGGDFSFTRSGASALPFPQLKEIGGDFQIQGNDNLVVIDGMSQLDSVGGEFLIFGHTALKELRGFENLRRVGQQFSIHFNYELEIVEGINALEYVGDHFKIIDGQVSSNTIDGFNSLSFVGGDFLLEQFASLSGFANLKTVSRSMTIRFCSDFILDDFNALEVIGKDLLITNNNEGLESITGFNALINIYEDLVIQDNAVIMEINGFNNLQEVHANLRIRDNSALMDITGFTSLHTVGDNTELSSNHNLNSISGLENLDTIVGSLNLQDNFILSDIIGPDNISFIGEDLTIRMMSSLLDLNFLSNVNGQLREIEIEDNMSLNSFNGLQNITTLDGALIINNNMQLSDIDALENINPSTITELTISLNPELATCQMRSICGYLSLPGAIYTINDNALGCNNKDEIGCTDTGISGVVFFDADANGIQDAMEFGIPNQSIHLEPDNIDAITNSNGTYYFYGVPNTDYVISRDDNPDWNLTTDSVSYQFEYLPSMGQNENYAFGLSPNFTLEEGLVNLSSETTRCNTDVNFVLVYGNEGTEILDGSVVLDYDPLCRFISSSPAPDILDTLNYKLSWNCTDLQPFENRSINLILEMPDEQQTGEPLKFITSLHASSTQNAMPMDSSFYCTEVRCSYDPNDKLVNPIGVGPDGITPPDSKLTYRIRFQNTGNAEAINIAITDTLDDHFDLATFRVLNSSFPVNTYMDGANIRFEFNNIWLPDSTSNEALSHGFVSFEISPLPNLPLGTSLENTAHIFFDANPPIVTNTTLTTYDIINASNEIKATPILQLYPNPAQEYITIDLQNHQFGTLNLIDLSGSVLQSIDLKSDKDDRIKISTGHLEPGVYILSSYDLSSKSHLSQKFVKF